MQCILNKAAVLKLVFNFDLKLKGFYLLFRQHDEDFFTFMVSASSREFGIVLNC